MKAKTILLLIGLILSIAVYAFAEVGELPKDLKGTSYTGPTFSGIFSVTPGTKGTATVSATGKNGLYFSCTTGATSGTAATVKVYRNGTTSSYYHASSGTVYFGKGTATTSIGFASYSTANQNNCAGFYW